MPGAGGRRLGTLLALLPTGLVQLRGERDNFGAELAGPPGRDAPAQLERGGAVQVEQSIPAPCCRRGVKGGPRGDFSLPNVRRPPGTARAVSRQALFCPIFSGTDLPVPTSRDGDAAPTGLQLLRQSISWVGQNPPPPRVAKIPLDFSGWEGLLFSPAAGAAC